MKNILFVHQSAELYGSDKVLLSLVEGLDRRQFRPIVMLPSVGPLTNALRECGIEVHTVPVIKVSRSTLSFRGLFTLPLDIMRSLRAMSNALNGTPIAMVHSNTLAVLSGALWARWRGLPHVWHVHEMIVKPRLIRHLFPWLLRYLADKVPCNSHATLKLLLESQPTLAGKATAIWNGLDRDEAPDQARATAFRERLGLSSDDVLVVLMGRINRWKGQGLLVKAAQQIHTKGAPNIRYLIVGGAPPGQEHFLNDLMELVGRLDMADRVTVMDFQSDIWSIWDACDIAVVPSTEPEPFGMVALEAMAARKPVIAAGHGGLKDIVIDNLTGRLVTPNDATALANAILDLAQDEKLRREQGEAGWQRLNEHFTSKRYIEGIEQVYTSIMAENL